MFYQVLQFFFSCPLTTRLLCYQVLQPLRARTHSPLRWDEPYVPYLRRAGMLPLARVVCARLPVMDAPLLTAFVDRWRPETHSFHLPCGEVSITLQDVAMILGMPRLLHLCQLIARFTTTEWNWNGRRDWGILITLLKLCNKITCNSY